MDDSNQIDVPPSFVALFTCASGDRLTQPVEVVRERYELCEELAQTLVERACTVLFKSHGGEREVLDKMRLGLCEAGSPVQQVEALWVVTRLAELLGWELPAAPTL